MFAYRHGFHAGNRADVFKHCVLTAAMLHLRQKEKPFVYLDTHAGAGRYRLDSSWSMQTGEAAEGIFRLLSHLEQDGASSAGIPEAVAVYAGLCRDCRSGGWYPGSPEIARRLSRPGDGLVLCELHPSEIGELRKNMHAAAREEKPAGRVHVHYRDGFEALGALLPPRSGPRRGLALLDPSYELPEDYRHLADAVLHAVPRWTTGCFLAWYPLVERRSRPLMQMKDRLAEGLEAQLSPADGGDPFFFLEMEFPAAETDAGMYGCGMLAVRPPWRFRQEAEKIRTCLLRLLQP